MLIYAHSRKFDREKYNYAISSVHQVQLLIL